MMKTTLVGYTGFVGGNLCLSNQFDACYNSKNIEEAFGTQPELLVYAGVPAEMFTANNFPEKDLETIENAYNNIVKIQPKQLVLISTISVYPDLHKGDELTDIHQDSLKAYGANRLYLEKRVREAYPSALIVRLPALFGHGIKKNFIFDLIHFIPVLLKTAKYEELFNNTPLARLYEDRGDGFYKCIASNKEDRVALKKHFEEAGFSALNFTDSRSRYQFFNLVHLWDLIIKALDKRIELLTVTSEPIGVTELYEHYYHKLFVNEVNNAYPDQNLKSIHAEDLGGKDGYIYDKQQVMIEIIQFIDSQKE